MVPRSIEADPTIIRRLQPPRIRWKRYDDLNSLLEVCERDSGFASGLNRLMGQCFPEACSNFVADLQSSRDRQISTLLATVYPNTVVGVVQLRLGGKRPLIANLCRTQSRRYKGLGLELLRRARLAAQDAGASSVMLRTNSDNRRLRSYYERNGWHIVRWMNDFSVVEYEYDLMDNDCVTFG